MAGSGTAGHRDGNAMTATFEHARGLATNRAGEVFIMENGCLRKLAGGVVTTLDAVALCEVKRDSSDLGYAVSKSAETLAWLAREHARRSARRHRSAGPAEAGLGGEP